MEEVGIAADREEECRRQLVDHNCGSGCDRKLQVTYELYRKEDGRELFLP